MTITYIGNKIDYIVPSFPVFEAGIRHMRYIWDDDNSGTVYDIFFREEGSLTVHSTIRLCSGHRNAFFIPVEEFNKTVDVENQLVAFGGEYFVIWRWSESECKSNKEDDIPQSPTGIVDYESVEEVEEEIVKSTCADSEVEHFVVFKCIGSTKEHKYQEVLAESALLKRNNKKPKVRIRAEPMNPFDSNAIAVECFVNSNWEHVGYLVREVLDSVHQVLQDNAPVSVELEWVKFITHWSKSCPGWYCGIKITRKGM